MLALLLMGATASYWAEMDNCKGPRGWAFDQDGNRHAVCADAGAKPDFLFADEFE
jgi:hypothetical protein